MDRYYWQGYLNKYEVLRFEYNEELERLRLFDVHDWIVADISFAGENSNLANMTNDEINDYLLENFEEYTWVKE
jgi:hypothetical protein